MSASILVAPVARPATGYVQESLDACAEELARLRLSIVLTAKWEAAESGDALRRKELRADLDQLHALYFQMIDEIAMNFGVKAAIHAKEKVERTVSIPPELKRAALREDGPEESSFDL